jgi:hypothetical protein
LGTTRGNEFGDTAIITFGTYPILNRPVEDQ